MIGPCMPLRKCFLVSVLRHTCVITAHIYLSHGTVAVVKKCCHSHGTARKKHMLTSAASTLSMCYAVCRRGQRMPVHRSPWHTTTATTTTHTHCPTTTDVFGRRSVSELVSSRAAVAAVTTAVHHMPCPALLDRAWTLSYVYT